MMSSGGVCAEAATAANASARNAFGVINGTSSDFFGTRLCTSPSRSSACARRARSSQARSRRPRSSCRLDPAPVWPSFGYERLRASDLLGVDLRALQRAGVIDVDRFPFAEHVDAGDAGLAMSVASLFRPAE